MSVEDKIKETKISVSDDINYLLTIRKLVDKYKIKMKLTHENIIVTSVKIYPKDNFNKNVNDII